MKKKGPKRKLIGFMAGEKGSIGKLQALGLGIAGIIGSGLLIPEDAEASGWHSNGTSGDIHFNWGDYGWDNIPPHNDGGYIDDYVDIPGLYTDDWGDYTAHSNDYSDYPWWDWPNWGDWSGDWNNAPPSVEIEVT